MIQPLEHLSDRQRARGLPDLLHDLGLERTEHLRQILRVAHPLKTTTQTSYPVCGRAYACGRDGLLQFVVTETRGAAHARKGLPWAQTDRGGARARRWAPGLRS